LTGRGRRDERPPQPQIVLASGSPRRRELLATLGLSFAVRPVDLDETPRAGEEPRAYVARLAVEKAAAEARSGALVLAADTVVVLPEQSGARGLLGKPSGPAEAEAMLARLVGREHVVYTGVALLAGGGAPDAARRAVAIEESRVRIAPLDADEIAWYVATGEPLDKAGAYAIQHPEFQPVARMDGCFASVMGLPVCHVILQMRKLDIQPNTEFFKSCETVLEYNCPVSDKTL